MSYAIPERGTTPKKGMFHRVRIVDIFREIDGFFLDVCKPIEPLRYPGNARQQDLQRIGQDMRKAMREYDEQAKKAP